MPVGGIDEAMAATNEVPRTALVTGAARRIGRAIAGDLAAQGWQIVVHYHTSADEASQVVADIRGRGGAAVALCADLSDEAAATALLPRAAAELGPITLLVNNASIFELDRPENADLDSWQRHMAINLRAPLVLTQGFLAQLPPIDDQEPRALGAHANLVNLIDTRVFRLTPNYTSYSVSKVGLWGLTQHLALALAPRIRVNGIAPGPALPSVETPDEAFVSLCQAMPLQHGTNPDEICRALRFILDAPGMTGQVITLDGGQHLGWLLPGQLPPTS